MSDVSQGPGWWQASDGKWYPPEQAPGAQPTTPPAGGSVPNAPATGGFAAPVGGTAGPNPIGPGGAPLASWGQRAIGFLIDWVIVVALFVVGFIVMAIVGAISSVLGLLVGVVIYVAAVGVGLYIGYLNGQTGQSPGKALTGLKVVNAQTGELIGGGMGVVRYLAHIVDSLICYIGWFFPLWDAQRQTIADKLIGTVVLAEQPTKPFSADIFKA